jgi:hypothetical protein
MLKQFFTDLVQRHFISDLGFDDRRAAGYVAGVLARFAHVDELYRIRNARGKRLEDVGEMLLESNPLLGASSFDREREVRKHIGDYTLFFAGIFPERIAWLRNRGASRGRPDAFVDYIQAGRESYYIVSRFDQFEYRQEAPLFRRLSETFELCVYGLNQVRRELERMQANCYRRMHDALDAGA